MKKIVERDRVTGMIKENLYKGQHTHPPPKPSKLPGRSSSLSRATAKGGPAAAVQAKQVRSPPPPPPLFAFRRASVSFNCFSSYS